MKIYNILIVLVIGILVVSSTGGFLGARENTSSNGIGDTEAVIELENFYLNIGEPTFSYQDDFVTVELAESESFMSDSGEPMLPVITKTFDFPVGTRIDDVNVNINWERLDLDKKVTPTPVIIPKSVDIDPNYIKEMSFNEEIYSSAELYPSEPYTIKYGAGLKDMEHVMFVNVKCYPQYSPANDYINIPTKINIDIELEVAEPTGSFAEQYDLIIITHDAFVDEFQPLVDHKISKGIITKMVTVDEIYAEYASESTHDFEQIKMYLADHVLDWDTKFVLLAGGHIGQTYEWYIPDFRSNNYNEEEDYNPPYDETYSSDLYYADVYYVDTYGSYKMDNWDSNGNGIYAEGPDMPSGIDIMDYYPDVHLGRIPLRYEWEADVIVNKIIDYENNADDSWFKKAVLAGGDGFPPERYGDTANSYSWEGEMVCDEFAELLANRGVESTKCYCSDEGDIQVTDSYDVYTEVSKGCGFVHLTGHASPAVLGSYTPGTGISPPPLVPFYTIFNIIQYDNKGKPAFMICEGCHNAQFDVTTQDLIADIFENNPDFIMGRWEWIPHDASSWFLLEEGGGAIAVIGNTALGYGGLNDGCKNFVGGWIMLRFAEAWGVDGENYTGSVWTTGINGYIDNFNVYNDFEDRKTIEERALIGDPSVRLGGYGLFLDSDESEKTKENYDPVSIFVPTWSVGDNWTYKIDNIDIDLTPTDGRSLMLKISTGDIHLEVTEVRSDSYITSVTTNDLDATFGGIFDFYLEDVENIDIPIVSLDDISIDGEIVIDKETLGIKEIDLGLSFDLIENLDNLKDLIGLELPRFLNLLVPYISIPANIKVNIEFENPFEILQFPLENDKVWGTPANTFIVNIDGSVESIWLNILNILNRFVNIIPDDLAKYLPNIDIAEILNDMGYDTSYTIDIPNIPNEIEKTPLFQVMGSKNIDTEAGSYNAAKISFMENNGNIYYAESNGNIVKIIGYLSKYIPIIQDINLELKSTNK